MLSDQQETFFASATTVECNPLTEYACNDGLSCYFKTEKCDRFINCADNSDEKECTCLDYLEPSKFCDGFQDCLEGEDEKNCNCPEGKFNCGYLQFSPICISEELRCDNVFDCEDGRDEEFCFELCPDVPMDPKVFGNPHASGVTHVQTAGGWKPLSLEFEPASDEAIDSYLKVKYLSCKFQEPE